MLNIQHQAHFDKVRAFADATGRLKQFQAKLDYLGSYADPENTGHTQCVIGYDWAPYSFSFLMMKKDTDGEYKPWFNGGLIFHGEYDRGGDGGAPTFSVNVNPMDGWEIHT